MTKPLVLEIKFFWRWKGPSLIGRQVDPVYDRISTIMDRTAAFNHGPRRSVSYNAIRTSAGPTVDSMYIAFQFFTDGALLKRLSFSTPVPAGAQQGWTTDDLVDVVRKEIHHLRKHEAFLSRLFGKLEVGLAVVDEVCNRIPNLIVFDCVIDN